MTRAAQRDDGTLSADDLIAAYKNGVEALRAAVSGMSLDELRARPIPGQGSTLEGEV